jgi:hypothetical protein
LSILTTALKGDTETTLSYSGLHSDIDRFNSLPF